MFIPANNLYFFDGQIVERCGSGDHWVPWWSRL
ncbi:hypothetical protein rv5_gp173 [Escherichia phage V5]|uniref:Uncharacterized protein n=1 Tax=Escherichia phage V5 TaxID=399183 RepID=B3RGW2_9CAUD|nr:hypothetical protein rv5_gp173 [Escherichia phage V5]ABI79243.1 hypothetical protein [Escherichia phage V5]